MKKIRDYLHIAIFMVTALLVAVVGLKAYSVYREETALQRQEYEEILARNAQAQNRVMEMQAEIEKMTADKEALQDFINDAMWAAEEVQRQKAEKQAQQAAGQQAVGQQTGEQQGVGTNGMVGTFDDGMSGAETISGNSISGNSVSGNGTISGNSVSGNGTISGNSVSGNGTISGNSVSGNGTISGNSVSDNGMISGNNMSGNGTIPGDSDILPYDQLALTLQKRREICTSYEETQKVSKEDKAIIAANTYDFSNMKIACLGDSITAAANLEGKENYLQYAYPSRLQEMLGAKEVYNLGIGGSSIGRYWADAFVDRYKEIPKDSDIILVMGGTNDGFCVSDKEFGCMETREYRTFCGDLDELMKGLREEYPDAVIFFATPLPNVLQDYLMSEREYLLPQNEFVRVIWDMAREYDFELIDLYNSNVLDSHDAAIITEYMPDGVHANPEGYQILAQRFASEIVQYYNRDMEQENEGSISTLQ